jgi:hypothetical protein
MTKEPARILDLADRATNFRVHLGGSRFHFLPTLKAARLFCSEHFQRTGVVLCIEAPHRRTRPKLVATAGGKRGGK